MSDSVRFLADENFRQAIVDGLRRQQPDIDIQTVVDVNISGMADPQLLVFAAQAGRVLVSHDVNTMPNHFAVLLNSGQHSAGLILIPQLIGIREAIDALHLVWEASTLAEWVDVIDYLPWR